MASFFSVSLEGGVGDAVCFGVSSHGVVDGSMLTEVVAFGLHGVDVCTAFDVVVVLGSVVVAYTSNVEDAVFAKVVVDKLDVLAIVDVVGMVDVLAIVDVVGMVDVVAIVDDVATANVVARVDDRAGVDVLVVLTVVLTCDVEDVRALELTGAGSMESVGATATKTI